MLKKKNILLLISSLDISDDEISIVKLAIDDEIRKKGQYKIEWIESQLRSNGLIMIRKISLSHDVARGQAGVYILRYSSLERHRR